MSEQRRLEPAVPVEAAGLRLYSPSLRADVTVSRPDELTGGTRGSAAPDVRFLALLDATGVEEQHTVELDYAEWVPPGGQRTRGGSGDFLQLDVPAPAQGFGQFVLDVGVDGAWRWHFGEDVEGVAGGRGGGGRRYTLSGDTGQPAKMEDTAPDTRGLIGKLGKRVVKVLAYKVLEIGGAWAANKIARHWEDEHRPHRLRAITVDNLGDPLIGVPSLTQDQLRPLLTGGRTLLLVHGFCSRIHSCFGSMPADVARGLFDHYGGRVFAFDHPTLSYDPAANARWLAEQLPMDVNPTIDVISHSRGGLVTRSLFERNDLAVPAAWFERALLVAAPNEGTVLASSDKLGALLDIVTNVVGWAPDNPFTDVLEVALTIAKHLAVGAMNGLDGWAAMNPSKQWLDVELPNGAKFLDRYRAIGANYEPPEGSPLFRIARDIATDALFSQQDNDLVVPTDGTDIHATIAPALRIAAAGGVDHSGYWRYANATDHLRQWLPA
jgi:hypothetical protein